MAGAAGLALLASAAIAEIVGCYLVFAVARLGWHPLWLGPAILVLLAFAGLLAALDTGGAGRTFAIYGGVYVAASLVWLRGIEGVPLRPADLAGAALVVAGSAVILFAGRSA